jgi:hypothetical protein
MTHQPTLFNPSEADERPLPLIVAARWNFPLAHVQTVTGLLYAVQDWLRGLSGEEDTRRLWTDFKPTKAGEQMSDSIVPLPYKASDGKTYKRDHTSDKGLYLIAQYLRVKHDRPVLDEIRRFLAAAGAFVDEARRDPDVLLEGVTNPDKLIDAVIEYYRKRGKDDQWIQARIEGKINRNQFTAALAECVRDMLKPHYATATDDVYRELWGRGRPGCARNCNCRGAPTCAITSRCWRCNTRASSRGCAPRRSARARNWTGRRRVRSSRRWWRWSGSRPSK